jgi:hypothetical protein
LGFPAAAEPGSPQLPQLPSGLGELQSVPVLLLEVLPPPSLSPSASP